MSVFKIEKTKDFTIMSNHHLRDKNLSLKAKGLLSYMFSLPDDWDYSLMGLCAICKEKKDAIRSTLKELQKYHYLEIEKVRGENGYFEYNYLIYEKPHFVSMDLQNNPDMENPYLDKPDMENPPQQNTNKQNTNNKIDKSDKGDITFENDIPPFFVAEEHNILTLELIKKGYMKENDLQIFYYDDLFEKLLRSNNSYKDLLIIVDYISLKVVNRNFMDDEGNTIENKFGYFKNALLNNLNKLEMETTMCESDELEWFER